MQGERACAGRQDRLKKRSLGGSYKDSETSYNQFGHSPIAN